MNFLDISYHRSGSNDPSGLLRSHSASMGYLDHLPSGYHPYVVKFMNYEGRWKKNRIQYFFLKAGSSRFWIPIRQNTKIKNLHPDIILFHGLIFPVQLMVLASQLGKKTRLIVQHHAGNPSTGPGRILQKLADRYISAYFFSSAQLAKPWLDAGIIKKSSKIFELPAGSTTFRKSSKEEARHITGVSGDEVFLWVGRLNANKDPLTVMTGFLQYTKERPGGRLYMIYQTSELIGEVKEFIRLNEAHDHIILVGEKPAGELEAWYNSADYFISGSHSESCGYALIESMACGCIPVITDIPAFKKLTDNGRVGIFYKPGDPVSLLDALRKQRNISKNEFSKAVMDRFYSALSFSCIADSIDSVYKTLTAE